MKTKSQIFTEAHKIARTLEGNYSARFVLALEIVRTEKETFKFANCEKLALDKIKSGANWNGKVYSYSNKKSYVFINNEKWQVINKEEFEKEANSKIKDTVTYAGFSMKNTQANYTACNKYGYDAIERI